MNELRSFKEFSKEEITQIAYEYATSAGTFSMSFLADKYYTKKYIISKILAFAITNNLVNDDITSKIIKTACKNAKPHGGEIKVRKYYENLLQKRKDNLYNLTKSKQTQTEILQLESILSSYFDFFSDEDGAPSYDDLSNKLEFLLSSF